ncbi:group protein [Moniliophthora roreri]|nr:group protein [Moniliophthora roreri]
MAKQSPVDVAELALGHHFSDFPVVGYASTPAKQASRCRCAGTKPIETTLLQASEWPPFSSSMPRHTSQESP